MILQEIGRDMCVDCRQGTLTALDLDHSLRSELFSVAKTNWNNNFDPEVMKGLLEDPYGNHLKLRSIRKAGLVLRSAHHLFADELMPANTYRIVKAIGIQNDWINLRGEPNAQPIMDAVQMFTPAEAEPEMVDDYLYHGRINDITTFISAVSSLTDVDPKTFHKMRISLKHFLNLYRMFDLLPGSSPSSMLGRIDAVNELLGQSHDGALHIVDGNITYNTTSIRIDPELSWLISGVLDEIAPASPSAPDLPASMQAQSVL